MTDPRVVLAEIQQRADAADIGGGLAGISVVTSDVPRLVKALTDVLDEFDYYSKNGTEDEQDVIAAIRQKLAAALAGES